MKQLSHLRRAGKMSGPCGESFPDESIEKQGKGPLARLLVFNFYANNVRDFQVMSVTVPKDAKMHRLKESSYISLTQLSSDFDHACGTDLPV